MSDNSELMLTIRGIIEKRGKAAQNKAKQEVLNTQYSGGVINTALKYFVRVNAKNSLPVFPALVHMSCEAAGGDPETTNDVSAALILIAWAADIHDDIIDNSTHKFSHRTIFGKFGVAVALLTGDALIAQGYHLLYQACKTLNTYQRDKILNLISQVIFEISRAEVKDVNLRNSPNLSPADALVALRLKAAVPALHCMIGGIMGNADEKTITALKNYGETFGTLALIVEEVMDVTDYEELNNRIRNEYLPLPILYANQDIDASRQIQQLIHGDFDKVAFKRLIEIVMDQKHVDMLKRKLSEIRRQGSKELGVLPDNLAIKELSLLLQVTG
jgi:Geranylgeranyl pyrophosphate synthase